MENKVEIRFGGILLSLGALITIICILFEAKSGWTSLTVEMVRTDYEAGKFLFENWSEIRSIWSWALLGNVFFAISSILLLKESKKIGWFPSTLFWSIYFVSSLILVFSFATCLGSFYNTLKVIDDRLYLFEIIRGIALYLFNIGALLQLSILIIYFHQGFSKQGIVPRIYAIVVLSLIVSSFALIFLGVISVEVFAITNFLAPFFLGFFYFKRTFQIAI